MEKRLLTLGVLAFVFSASAQQQPVQAPNGEFVTQVGEKAKVYVGKSTLVFNGGGVRTLEDGLLDNYGNIMVVGNDKSKFATQNKDNTNKRTDGGNIILRISDETLTSLKYGQLYIEGLKQENITGIVDKEYKDNDHGTYQQIALPFHEKLLSELDSQLKTISDSRWSQEELLVWNNQKARFDLLKRSQKTSDAKQDAFGRHANTAYYSLGSKNFKAASQKKTVKGVPYADKDDIKEKLTGAAQGINFGDNGNGRNYYGEKYNTYLQDSWDYSTGGQQGTTAGPGAWKDNFGKNIYQFGNPFLTNIDLSHIKATLGDALQGIRVEPTEVVTIAAAGETGSTLSKGQKIITYATTGAGGSTGGTSVPVGDNYAIIKPMQTFVLKLKKEGTTGGTTSQGSRELDFKKLRRFAYTPRPNGSTDDKVYTQSVEGTEVVGGVITMSSAAGRRAFSTSTVKELTVIALDANGIELGRTYYVVYNKGVSGQPSEPSTQVTAGNTVIGTFEEAKEGGLDADLARSYWLYINEANETDFKGKEIPLRLYSEHIKFLKFEVKENAQLLGQGQSRVSTGESFYVNIGEDKVRRIASGTDIELSSTTGAFGLYYGKPDMEIIEDRIIARPSATFIAYAEAEEVYKIVFDPSWRRADVRVYDMAGRLVSAASNVDTESHFALDLQVAKGTYVVTAISEKGQQFSQKIIIK